MRVCVPLLILLAAGLMPGCLVVPFGYPTWSRTPELKVKAEGDQVLTLRVRRQMNYEFGVLSAGPIVECVIEKVWIHQDAESTVASNALGCTYGFAGLACNPMLAGIPTPMWNIRSDNEETWLYRPGYQVIVLGNPLTPSVLTWLPTASHRDRLEALAKVSEEPAWNRLTAHAGMDSQSLETYRAVLRLEWTRLAHEIHLVAANDHDLAERLNAHRRWWAPPEVVE